MVFPELSSTCTGLYLLFMSGLTVSDFTNYCQEHGWSLSNVTQITGEDLEISEDDLLWIQSVSPKKYQTTSSPHWNLDWLSAFFTVNSKAGEKRNNPTGKWRWAYKNWLVVTWSPYLQGLLDLSNFSAHQIIWMTLQLSEDIGE